MKREALVVSEPSRWPIYVISSSLCFISSHLLFESMYVVFFVEPVLPNALVTQLDQWI